MLLAHWRFIRLRRVHGNHGLDGTRYAVVGMSLVIGMAFVDFSYVKRFSYLFLALSIIGLVAVMFIGNGQGVSRWITIGGVNVQPSSQPRLR